MNATGVSKPIDIYNISNDNIVPPNTNNPLPPNIHPNMSPNTYYIETLEFLYNEYNIPRDYKEDEKNKINIR
tara:strand:+ start:85 stop:300 length:216 start_codon:yes stop_codon:yes gene_type:complete